MVKLCVSLYLDVVKVTDVSGFQLKCGEGVVDCVSTASLDGPAAQTIVWVVVWKVQGLDHSLVLVGEENVLTL